METNQEVRYLVAKLQEAEANKDDVARNKYFEELLYKYNDLVYFVVDKFPIPPRVGYDDVVQVAKVGLWKGFRRFDPDISKATTYITRVIKGEILRYYRDFCWQWKVPRRLKEAVSGSANKDLDIIAKKHNLSLEEITEIQNILHSNISHEDHHDQVIKENLPQDYERQKMMEQLFVILDEQETNVIKEHFLEGRGLVDIADIYCMESTAVKRILERALDKLRTQFGDIDF